MRIALKILIVFIIVIAASLAAIPLFVDPNDYKDEISSQVEKATGRALTLQGDIELSVFPWIALELGPLSLSNAKGFKAETFAQVEAAAIRIKLLPLLSKQLEMDTIVLDGLVLNLETAKDGTTNWDDLSGKSSPSSAKDASESTTHKGKPALAGITIAGVQLTNANVLWADASKNENYQLRSLNLKTDPLEPGEPTAIEMDFDLISIKPEAKAHVSLITQVTLDLEKQQYALNDLSFKTIAQGKALPFSNADVALEGDIFANMEKQDIQISDLVLKVKANKDQQEIDATLSAAINSNLSTQLTHVKDLKLNAQINDPKLPVKEAKLTLASQISADLSNQTISLTDLIIELEDLIMKADINATKVLSDNPNYVGSLHIAPFNLRKLANSLDIELPEMADDSTLEVIEVKADLSGTSNAISAKQLAMTLDQSSLTGQLSINNFVKPSFNFKLNLDEIDADRYLPPVKETTEKEASTPTNAATAPASDSSSPSELPLESLRQINAKGTLDIGKLKATGIRSENIHISINADNGLVSLSPMSANLYEGQYKGNVVLDARGKALNLAIDENIAGVQAGPLLNDMTGDAPISGTAKANAKLKASGKTIDELKSTLTGNGGFSFENGALQGINIGESIRKAKAALKGESLSSDEPVQTDFSTLSGTFTATNGVVNNQDLAMKSPLLRINGAGQASIPTEAIDYSLKVAIVSTSKGQGGKELDELKGLTIPVKITGTFSKPKPTVDLASLVKDQAKEELKAKAEEKLKEKLGSDIGGLLGGALGSDTQNASEEPLPSETTTDEPVPEEEPASPEKQLEDALKDKLKGFF